VYIYTYIGAATVKKVVDVNGNPLSVINAGEKGSINLIDRSNRSGEEMGLREVCIYVYIYI
jgi:hypothetical protein